MAIKTYQPTSAGMRFRTGLSFDEVTKTTPEKGLRERLNHSGGRNNTGRVTADHRGGGHRSPVISRSVSQNWPMAFSAHFAMPLQQPVPSCFASTRTGRKLRR